MSTRTIYITAYPNRGALRCGIVSIGKSDNPAPDSRGDINSKVIKNR